MTNDLTDGARYLKAQSADAAAERLRRAATYAALHASKPLFHKTMKVGRVTTLVRLDWPGVLRVFDPATGELLAESEPGRPGVLRAGFQPSGGQE